MDEALTHCRQAGPLGCPAALEASVLNARPAFQPDGPAVAHRRPCSWPGSGVQCFQRLEFLGDAVLDAMVTTHFYTAFR